MVTKMTYVDHKIFHGPNVNFILALGPSIDLSPILNPSADLMIF